MQINICTKKIKCIKLLKTNVNIIDSLTNVTIFKSVYIINLTIVNFIYHLIRIYLNKTSENNEVNSYAFDKSDNGKYSKFSFAISLLKEAIY